MIFTIRFSKIRYVFSLSSHMTTFCSGIFVLNSKFAALIFSTFSSSTCLNNPTISTFIKCITTLLLAALLISNKSSINTFKRRDFLSRTLIYSFLFSSSFSFFNRSVYVMIAVSGVLRSWETFVTSSVFIRSFFTSSSTAFLNPF